MLLSIGSSACILFWGCSTIESVSAHSTYAYQEQQIDHNDQGSCHECDIAKKPPRQGYVPCCHIKWPGPAKDLAAPSFSITVYGIKSGQVGIGL